MEYNYASRGIATIVTEELAHQQDTVAAMVPEAAGDNTSPVHINNIEHSVIQESHTHISPMHIDTIDILEPIQKEMIPSNCLQSIVIPQAQPAALLQ